MNRGFDRRLSVDPVICLKVQCLYVIATLVMNNARAVCGNESTMTHGLSDKCRPCIRPLQASLQSPTHMVLSQARSLRFSLGYHLIAGQVSVHLPKRTEFLFEICYRYCGSRRVVPTNSAEKRALVIDQS